MMYQSKGESVVLRSTVLVLNYLVVRPDLSLYLTEEAATLSRLFGCCEVEATATATATMRTACVCGRWHQKINNVESDGGATKNNRISLLSEGSRIRLIRMLTGMRNVE
jgi:L-rhamnose mutarotase